MKPPQPGTKEDVLRMAAAVRLTIGGAACWSYAEHRVQDMGPGLFCTMLLQDWETSWSEEKQACIITLYRLT